jgi:hypothetical protein
VAARPVLARLAAGGAMLACPVLACPVLACPVLAVGLVVGQPMTSRLALAMASRPVTVAASPARGARIAHR